MKERFSDMLKFGINLKLSGSVEDKYYAQRLRYFIMESEDYDASSGDDETIDIWKNANHVMSVNIIDSVLTLKPIVEGCYDAIMLVLEFISIYHEKVQEDFKKLQVPLTSQPEDSDEEDEDSDDFELI